MSSEKLKPCNEPQAHPSRCGCEPEVPVGYVSGERFHAEHERLRECPKERAALEAENARLAAEFAEFKQDRRAALAKINEASKLAEQRMAQIQAERDAALAQLAAIQQAKGEVGLTGEYHADVNALLDRQSAMAADMETWKGMVNEALEYHSAAMIELARILGGDVSDEPRLKWVCGIAMDVVSERDALRAELAAVKGQEAVPAGWALTLPDGRVTLEKAYPRWIDGDMGGDGYSAAPLYALPPASPDVEGLVRALDELCAAMRRYFPDENPAAHNAMLERADAALSTWRQAQESDPCKK